MKRIAIIGAGAAGLSFAYFLSKATRDRFTCLLLDPDEKSDNDRTWAYWGTPFGFDHLVSHRWDTLRLRDAGRDESVITSSEGYRYIPADRFYRVCKKQLQGDSRFSFIRGRVESIRQDTKGVALSYRKFHAEPEEPFGIQRLLEADLVFDSVFGPKTDDPALLRQSFVGWEIRCAEPLWDSRQATLMDFDSEAIPSGLKFFYVLPANARRALIEYTIVGESCPTADYLERRLERYLDELAEGKRWEILRREKGTIPLYMNRAPERDGRIYRLGVAAGAARPSTGYAFRSIVETSRSLAAEIASRLHEPTMAMPQVRLPLHLGRRARFFDAVFLELLLREPEQVPTALLRLFERNRSDRVFRFLSGASTIRDEISVVTSLPWGPFIKALLRLAGRRWSGEESRYPRPIKYPSGSISSRRIRSSS